jgi:hypothetical protein
MGVTVNNLIAGPADIYIGAFGAAEPADSAVATAPASAAWTDMGGTNDGVKWSVDQDFLEMEVDQVVDRVGSRLTKRMIKVETQLAEATLANIVNVLNGGTVTASAAFATYDPATATSATQPTYRALLFDGWAPGASPFRRRVIVRRVLNIDGMKEHTYSKDKQLFVPVTFTAHYVSASTLPFKIVDQLT